MSTEQLIDQQHKSFENPTEWRRRRAFLLANFNDLPFERLVCLSHCYINSTMHGAVYPPAVMEEVQQYSLCLQQHEQQQQQRHAVKRRPDAAGDSGSAAARARHGEGPPAKVPRVPPSKQQLEATVGRLFAEVKRIAGESSADSDANGSASILQRAAAACGLEVSCSFADTSGGRGGEFACRLRLCDAAGGWRLLLAESRAASRPLAEQSAIDEFVQLAASGQQQAVPAGAEAEAAGGVEFELRRRFMPAPAPLDLDAQLAARRAEADAAVKEAEVDEARVSQLAGSFYLREIESDSSGGCAANVLKSSADFSRVPLEYEFSASGQQCRLLLAGRFVASGAGVGKAAAKAAASGRALDALRRRCWTLVVRSDAEFMRSQAAAGQARHQQQEQEQQDEEAGRIKADSVGHRLLRGMGWSGSGGVGKRLEGRADPVVADVRAVPRAGLGADESDAGVRQRLQTLLQQFAADSEDRDDLFFSTDYSIEERKVIHTLCSRLGLASRSYNSADGGRCLVVSRKRSAEQLVRFVQRNGGETARYRLLPPAAEADADGAADPGDGAAAT